MSRLPAAVGCRPWRSRPHTRFGRQQCAEVVDRGYPGSRCQSREFPGVLADLVGTVNTHLTRSKAGLAINSARARRPTLPVPMWMTRMVISGQESVKSKAANLCLCGVLAQVDAHAGRSVQSRQQRLAHVPHAVAEGDVAAASNRIGDHLG